MIPPVVRLIGPQHFPSFSSRIHSQKFLWFPASVFSFFTIWITPAHPSASRWEGGWDISSIFFHLGCPLLSCICIERFQRDAAQGIVFITFSPPAALSDAGLFAD